MMKRKSKEVLPEDEEKAPRLQEIPDEDDPPRRKKKKLWVIPACLLLLATLVIASLPSAEDMPGGITVSQEIISGTAQPGTIVTVLTGAGTLAPEKTEDVCVPSVVEVESYHVQNGDAVRKGDVLATVKPTTVATAITELQDVMDELDRALESKRQSDAVQTVYSPAKGRVKVICIQPDEAVADTMLRDGALMKISLDGRMKVEIPGQSLAVGQALTVRLEDGKTLDGRVDSVRQDVAVVTVPDDQVEPDTKVTVEDGDGNTVGQGRVQINSEMKITGYYGTVSYIPVSVNQRVSAGGTLIQLKDTGNTAEYDRLFTLRQDLEEQMDELYALYPDGLLRAKEDGVVSGIPENGDFEALTPEEKEELGMLAAGKEQPALNFLSASGNDGGSLVLLGDTENQDPPPGEGGEVPPGEGGEVPPSEGGEVPPGEGGEIPPGEGGEVPPGEGGEIPPGEGGEVPPTEGGEPAQTYGPGIVIQQTPSVVQLVSDPNVILSNIAIYDSNNQVVYPPVGTSVIVVSESVAYLSGPADGMPDMSGFEFDISGMMGDFGGFGGTYVPPTPAYETYEVEKTTVLKLSPQDSMCVEVLVDELDILSLKPGMQATVTLDAFKGESLEATVDKISRRGENSGGNTKFAVTVRLDGTPKMLEGMNASVSVVTDSRDAAITVPAAAVQEIGGKTYLYTGYSQKDDTLLNPVEVMTGVSDAQTVEIISGLEAGQSYYYRYADSITYSFARDL